MSFDDPEIRRRRVAPLTPRSVSPDAAWHPARRRFLSATLLLLLSSCSRSGSLDGVLDSGNLDEADAAAIVALIDGIGIDAESLPVVEEGRGVSFGGIRIREGRIVGLGLGGLRDLSEASGLDALETLRVAGPIGSLDGLELPRLRRLDVHVADRALRSAELDGLPALEELSILRADFAGAPPVLHLPSLRNLKLEDCQLLDGPRLETPSLRRLNLEGNGLADLAWLDPELPLEFLGLDANRFESLRSLRPPPTLTSLSLRDNPWSPILGLDAEQVPQLASVDLRDTPFGAIPEELAGLETVRLEDFASQDQKAFDEALDDLLEVRAARAGDFVEEFQGSSSGRIEGVSGSCKWSVGTFSTPRLSCLRTIESARGRAFVRLVEVDPTGVGRGGGSQIRVTARIRVGAGTARIYLREREDLTTTARVLAGVGPRVKLDEERDVPTVFDGYRAVTASPGAPARAVGEIPVLGTSAILWVEAPDEARDIEIVIEPS